MWECGNVGINYDKTKNYYYKPKVKVRRSKQSKSEAVQKKAKRTVIKQSGPKESEANGHKAKRSKSER